jgi:hypothetical protein
VPATRADESGSQAEPERTGRGADHGAHKLAENQPGFELHRYGATRGT